MLQTARGHKLHADADTQERPTAPDHRLFQRIDHAIQRIESTPAIAESADAGQHDSVGRGDDARVGGNQNRLVRHAFKRLRGRVQVARPVIDDRDAHAEPPPSTPLVEGTASAWRGSISTAWRNARASPL